jgi:hypothetical protein
MTSDANRFHDVELYYENLVVVGEFASSFEDGGGNYLLTTNSATNYDIVTLVMDTTGTDIIARQVGALYADHGDAVDVIGQLEFTTDWTLHIYGIGELQGGTGANTITPTFPATYGAQTLPLVNGKDVFMYHYTFSIGGSALVQQQSRVLHGDGDDYGHDITVLVYDFDPMKPNEIIYCGQFNNEIDTSNAGTGSMVNTLGGATGIDGYIGSITSDLAMMGWFNREGSALGLNESVNALTYHDGSMYAVGKFERTPAATLLNAGGLSLTNTSVTGLFTVQFDPSGTFIAASQATPSNSGVNQHTDVIGLDTSLITTGYIDMPAVLDNMVFDTLTIPNGTVYSNTGNKEAFIARFNASTNAFFKGSGSELEGNGPASFRLYPNPSDGTFILEFDRKLSGTLTFYNAMGQQVLGQSVSEENRLEVHLKQPPGIYLFELGGGEVKVCGRCVID